MILQRVQADPWLSNAYLIADEPGGKGVLVDSNEATDPLVERVEREGTEITHILLTHHHYDHVVGVEKLAEHFGVPVLGHELCAEQVEAVTETIAEGDVVETGGLVIEAIHTPGHCADHLALRIDGTRLPDGRRDLQGHRRRDQGAGRDRLDDLRDSIMEKLMKLPPETRLHPGHMQPTTVGEEWESNPFVRVWRGLDEPGSESCTVGPGDDDRVDATLLLWAPGLRWHQQGLGPLRRRRRGDRRRLPDQEGLSVRNPIKGWPLALLATLAALALLAGCGDDEDSGADVVEEVDTSSVELSGEAIDGLGYSFELAEGFEDGDAAAIGDLLGEQAADYTIDALATGETIDAFATNVNVVTTAAPDDVDLDEIADASLGQLEEQLGALGIGEDTSVEVTSEPAETTVGGEEARQYDFATSAAEQSFAQRQIVTIRDDTAYTITFSVADGAFDEQVASFAAMIESWEWDS